MKIRILALVLALLLCACSGPAGSPESSEPHSSQPVITDRAAPTDPSGFSPSETASLAGTVMKLPDTLVVLAAEPEVTVTVRFPELAPGIAPAGRLCRVEFYVDEVLDQVRDDFLLLPDSELSFQVSYTFTREMERDWSLLRVIVRCGDETLEDTVPVTLVNYPDEVYAAQAGDRLPYSIDVIRNHSEIVVYAKDEDGEYTRPVKVFICSPGYATPLGTFYLNVKNRWQPLFGNVWGQYGTRITGDVLFHSVPYYAPKNDRLKTGEYNRLGAICSMGCIRLCVRDAKWIYDNCPFGTPVNIFDSNTRPFDRPEPIRLDPKDPRCGWDPTDPSDQNPWNPLYVPAPPKPGRPDAS